MWKVISPRCCRETATVLNKELNETYPHEKEVILNWGNSNITRYNVMNIFGNAPQAVYRTVNKKECASLLDDLGHVPVVTEYTEPGVFQHLGFYSNGKGVKFVTNSTDFNSDLFSTKKVTGKEFRVYFCYKPLDIFKKVKLDKNTPDSAIQNSLNGYGYQKNPKELTDILDLKKYLTQLTTSVMNRLEISYGAVDFILEDETNLIYILEVNSAPTLFNYPLIEKFATIINERLG